MHRLTILRTQPADVWERLAAELAAGGSPPISMTRSARTVTFTCDTGEFMLRARVADALMSVSPLMSRTRFRSNIRTSFTAGHRQNSRTSSNRCLII